MSYRYLICLFILATATPLYADTKIILPDSKKVADGEENPFVQTTVPGDFKSLDTIVFALLTLSPQAPNKSLTAPFFPESVGRVAYEKKGPLYQYFRGVRKKGKTVTLRFSGDAMLYLDSPITLSQSIQGALEKTIKLHSPDCKIVEYEVDGQVVTEWDA